MSSGVTFLLGPVDAGAVHDFLGQFHGDVGMLDGGLQEQLADGAFDDADVGVDGLGQESDDVVGDVQVEGHGLAPQDGLAGFAVGSLDVDEQPPLEPADQAVFQTL